MNHALMKCKDMSAPSLLRT